MFIHLLIFKTTVTILRKGIQCACRLNYWRQPGAGTRFIMSAASDSSEDQRLKLRGAGPGLFKEAPKRAKERMYLRVHDYGILTNSFVVDRDRKKAEKLQKFEDKKAKSLTSLASTSPSKTQQKKAKHGSEEGHLPAIPAIEWYAGTGEKKGKSRRGRPWAIQANNHFSHSDQVLRRSSLPSLQPQSRGVRMVRMVAKVKILRA